jgi:hypothetical protein
MKRFRFNLDRVLHYRKLQVETEEGKLQVQLARLRDIESRIAHLEKEGALTQDAVRRNLACGGEVRPVELAGYPDYRFLLARGRLTLAAERRRRLEELERQRAAVIEAHRAREILERARAAAHQRWLAEYGKEQEATAAELYLNKWKRRAL